MDSKEDENKNSFFAETVHWNDLTVPEKQEEQRPESSMDIVPPHFVSWRNCTEQNPLYELNGDNSPVSWGDVVLSESIYPECEVDARTWIFRLMGYIPMVTYCQPNMPFMQALVHQYRHGLISDGDFIDEMILQVTQIKNREMIRGGWLDDGFNSDLLFKQYNNYLVQYKEAARERHCRILQYEPQLICSIPGELLIRDLFVPKDHEPPVGDDFHAADFKAATITRYRERYWLEGPEAANESQELFAFMLDLRKQGVVC